MVAYGGPEKAELRTSDDPDRLLVAAGEGDHEAFSLLFDRLSSIVHTTVYRVIRDPSLAQDVVQEVFLEVWQTSPRFDSRRGSAYAWVCTIARRRAIDRVRAVQASRERDRRVAERDRQVAYDPVWERVEVASEHARVMRAIERISELQRECVLLAYSEGFNYTEISERLGVPIGTVKTRLRAGLLKLRSALDSTSTKV